MYNNWKIENNKLIYSCGCKFDIIKEREGQFPLIKPGNPYKNWNYQCKATKMLLGDGNTAGVFQLESFLGKHWAKRLKPESVEHMSALTAILRPGVLEARSDKGISVTEMYCRYKNNEEVAIPLVPEIGYLLEDTYYQMLYQEDAMNIARDIAGFTPAQCDNLRKGISKKMADVIAKIKDDFIEGCKKIGKVSEEKAKLIFDSIEKSQRYSFNHSHSVSYGILSFVTAFAKAHFPEYFYTSYLEGASNKQKPLEERHKFIQDAKFFDIKVNRPDLGVSKPWFYSDKHKSILFGLTSIKGVGPSTIESVKKFYEANKDSWIQILVNCLYKLNSRAAQNIVKAGIISNGMQRKRQLHELNILYEVTAKGQITFIFNNCHLYDNLKDLLVAMNKLKKDGGGLHSEKDTEKINGLIYMLENPGYALEDSPEWIASVEEEILGIAISASLLDKTTKNAANVKCKDLLTGMSGYDMMVAAEINMVEQKEIKSGNNKGKIFLKIEFSDKTGTVSSVVWPEVFEKYGDLIKEGNTLCLGIYRDKKGNLVISGAWQI